MYCLPEFVATFTMTSSHVFENFSLEGSDPASSVPLPTNFVVKNSPLLDLDSSFLPDDSPTVEIFLTYLSPCVTFEELSYLEEEIIEMLLVLFDRIFSRDGFPLEKLDLFKDGDAVCKEDKEQSLEN